MSGETLGSYRPIPLEGIDAPERGQDFATKAKQFTSSLVFGKHVHILPREKDRYGRLVARVRVDDTDVSLELVKAGLAWHYKKYSSRIYHDPGCRYYNCKNCSREFGSKEEAHSAGYRGCKICRL